MIEYHIEEHIRHAATRSELRLRAVLDTAREILHIYVRPLLSGEHLLWVQVTQFDPSEPSDHLFKATMFEGERANRERLGLNTPRHLRRL